MPAVPATAAAVVLTALMARELGGDTRAPELGLPPASSPNRAHGWFPPPPEHQDRVLFVGDPAPLQPYFTGIRQVGTVGAATARSRELAG